MASATIDPLAIPGLTPRLREVLGVLDRLTKRAYQECWHAAKTIAQWIGASEWTVRNALRKLEAHGLIQIIRDYSADGPRTRRRIVLRWRTGDWQPDADNKSVTVDSHRQPRAISTTTDPSPHTPLYKDSEESAKQTDDDRRTENRTESSSSGSSREPSEPEPELSVPARNAVRSLVEALGDDPAVRQRAEHLARAEEPTLVIRAAGVLKKKAASLSNPWGYLRGILRNWRTEGPPPESTRPGPRPQDDPAFIQRFLASLEADDDDPLGFGKGGD